MHVGISIPFTAGFDIGFLYDSARGRPDIGIFSTIKKNYAGTGRFKATVGVSQTLGDRCNFDGTSAEVNVGIGAIGGSASHDSLSFDFGPQLGLGADLTHTNSLTIGDIARGVARIIYGNGGN